MAARSPSSSTPLVPIRSGRMLPVVAAVAGLIGLLAWVRIRFPGPYGPAPYRLSVSGWLVLGLFAFVLTTVVQAVRKLGPGWGVALVGALVASVVLAGMLSHSHSPTQQAAKPAFRQAQRLDITEGCPKVAELRAWATCVLGKATAATNKHLSPTTTTRPRSR